MSVSVLSSQLRPESSPNVSIVVPLFNEGENIRPLYRTLRAGMDRTRYTWEVIFVDDGSTDNSFRFLRELYQHDAQVRVLRLRRNYGQTAALAAAGFDAARGAAIVSLDGDLQNDPHDIGRLVEKLDEGYDVVSGWRVRRQESFLLRQLPSKVANWLISLTTGLRLHDYGCTLKAYRSEILKELRLYGEMHRFIPALMWGNGARAELPVEDRPRLHGKSKYGLSRTLRVLLDLITIKFCLTSLNKPLRFFGIIGLVTSGAGLVTCLYLAALRIGWGQPLADRPFLLLGILLVVTGVQFLCVGILAEIQIRTYHESSQKPVYAVREILDPEQR